MAPVFEECRRHPRVAGTHQAQIRRIGPRALEASLKTCNLGPGGCAFLSGGFMGLGVMLEMLINVSGRFVEAEGKVVYERRRRDGMVEVGVAFTNLAPPGPQVIEELVLRSQAGREAKGREPRKSPGADSSRDWRKVP